MIKLKKKIGVKEEGKNHFQYRITFHTHDSDHDTGITTPKNIMKPNH